MSLAMINVSAYKFVPIDSSRLPQLKNELVTRMREIGLKGSILIGTEGVNLFISGNRQQVDAGYAVMNSYSDFTDLPYKESPSVKQPFSRMLVRIKSEIVTMGVAEVNPFAHRAPYISTHELKQWYDEGRNFLILDTRNDYEVALGTFANSFHLDIKNFRDFPEAIKTLPEEMKEKTIVSFCTGGIRCEKGGEYLIQQGFKDVYQLHGGILQYFEDCGGAHFHGECFVFDKRVAVDCNLQETTTGQCYACRMPLENKESRNHDEPCHFCGGNPFTGDKDFQATGS
jgi:UPF0176 protein